MLACAMDTVSRSKVGKCVHLKSREISTAPAQHVAARGGMPACAMGKVGGWKEQAVRMQVS